MAMHDFLDKNIHAAIEREHEVENPPQKPTKPKGDTFRQEGNDSPFQLANYEPDELEIIPLDDEADQDDRALARASIRNVLMQTNNNLGALLALAQATEHPRAFEVAATFAKTIIDAAGKLDDMATEKSNKKGASGKDAPAGNVTNTQQNFYMSSEDAMKMIRDAAKAGASGENIDIKKS